MKKHFLILMLMSLLPLAGWADINFGVVQVDDYTYGGAQLNEPYVKDSEGSVMTKGQTYTVEYGKAYSDADCTTEVALKDMKGNTTYYQKITGIGAFNGKQTSVSFTCKKKSLTITVNKDFTRQYLGTTEPTIAISDWNADGLVTEADWSDTKAELGTLAYTYDGKGNKDYPGGVYPITFSGLSSDCYEIKYPTMNFTIVGTDMSNANVEIKTGTAFADQTYKGVAFTVNDLSGLVLKYNSKELVQGTDFDIAFVYDFKSFTAQTEGTQLATGTVQVLSQEGNVAIVEVLTNSVDNATWAGKKYKAIGANGTTRVQLLGDGTGNDYTTATGMWVTITPSFTNVGQYTYNVVFKGNYSGTKASVGTFTFNIVKAPLNVYVNNVSKVYDGTSVIPATATIAYSGLQGNDKAAAHPFGENAFKIEYVVSAKASTETDEQYTARINAEIATKKNVTSTGYALKPVKQDNAGGTINNYNLQLLENGMLTVTEKSIKIKPDAASKQKDENDPAFTVIATEAIKITTAEAPYVTAIDDQTTIANAYKVSREEGEDVDTYTMSLTLKSDEELAALAPSGYTPQQKTQFVAEIKTVLGNYDITPETALFTITAGTLYVYPKSVAAVYGEATPKFEVVATTAKGAPVTLTATPDVKIAGETAAPKNAGTYVLTLEGDAAAAGYTNIVKLDGQYTISPRPLTFTIATQTLAKGKGKADLNANNDANVKINNLVDGDIIGFELEFNQVTNEQGDAATGMIPANTAQKTYIDEGKLGEDANNTTYDKGIRIKAVAATNEKPNDNANYSITWSAVGKLIVGGGTQQALNFTSVDADAATIAAHAGETQTVNINFAPRNAQTINSSYGTWKAGYWNTLVLPFDISVAEISNAFGYAVVNVIDASGVDYNGGAPIFKFKLTMKGGYGNDQVIPANHPFALKIADDIVLTESNADKYYTFGARTIVAPDDLSVDAGLGCKFTGTYTTTAVGKGATNAGKYRFLPGDYDKNWIYTSKSAWNIVPFAAYIDLTTLTPEQAAAAVFTFEEIDGTTTAIRSIEADNIVKRNINAEGLYNLNGMKLNSVPTKKGVYIQNGKKVIIK